MQLFTDFPRGEVAIPSRCFQFRVGIGMAINNGSDISGKLWIADFDAWSSASGKIFDALNVGASFVLSECDIRSSPSESSFGSSWTAAAKTFGDFGLEPSSLMSGECL